MGLFGSSRKSYFLFIIKGSKVWYGGDGWILFLFVLYNLYLLSPSPSLIPAILKFPLSFYYKNKKIILYSQVSSNMIINIIILKIYIVANFKTRKIS